MRYLELYDEKCRENILNWWKSFQNDKATRAQMRRCSRLEEACLYNQVYRLGYAIPWLSKNTEVLACIASVLSHVKDNINTKTFAQQLSTHKGGKAIVSENRFRVLLASKDSSEFFRNLRRVVSLLNGKLNILSLIDGIIRWFKEHKNSEKYKNTSKLNYVWAREYFSSDLEEKQNKKEQK